MTFGDRFRIARKYGVLDTTDEDGEVTKATRLTIRNHMRACRLRNDGSRKETHPAWNSASDS